MAIVFNLILFWNYFSGYWQLCVQWPPPLRWRMAGPSASWRKQTNGSQMAAVTGGEISTQRP